MAFGLNFCFSPEKPLQVRLSEVLKKVNICVSVKFSLATVTILVQFYGLYVTHLPEDPCFNQKLSYQSLADNNSNMVYFYLNC